jgi:anti-sigma-K factor RskA
MTRDEKLALAGEYVLGAMDDAEREAFEIALQRDQELSGMVTRLQQSLMALDHTAPPEAASAALWERIDQRVTALGARPEITATMTSLPPKRKRAAIPTSWRIAAGIVLALGIGFVAGLIGARTEPRPLMIAVLMSEADATPGAIVEAFADNTVRIVPLESFAIPAGRILQVWTLPDPQTGPVSLGTFASVEDIRLAGPPLPQPQTGQLYEITLEPAPGSPTGRPTGPILVKGFAKPPV